MIRTFTLTSPSFNGEVVFEYSDYILSKYDTTSAQLTEQQLIYITKNLPRELFDIETFKEKANNVTVTETTKEITFDDFWKRYFKGRGVDNSSKKRTIAKWGKMKKSEQLKAFYHIGKYLNTLSHGTCPKYAETYLNAELWNN